MYVWLQISQLLDELGLAQVRNTKVWQLTASERIRLDVATKLLHDTSIIALDQPTKEMDIFDTFFLIDFLRRWALGDIGKMISLYYVYYIRLGLVVFHKEISF